ncbi:MAG: hypothetical protein F6K47_28760 [Symploca sp. SIO2E6]|nr:hypothetical protein [Symploca sp. SIO2E6]
MSNNPLLAAINQVISLTDGIAEYSNDDILEVLLPIDVAKVLEVSESVSFTTRADLTNSYFVTYNSEIFDRLSDLLAQKGYLAALAVKYDSYLKTKGFEKLVNNTLYPQNGLIRVGETKPGLTPYILCNIAYTAESDEKRLGMVSFFINGITGVAGVDIGDALSWESDRIPLAEIDSIREINGEQLLSIAQNWASQVIDTEITPWRKSLGRKLSRDEERIKAYYSTIVSEIRAKIRKKHLEGAEEEKELARISATQMELKRKLADLQKRYSLSVSARLHSALVIMLQTVHIECELIRKKQRRSVTVVWNPYLKVLEPLRCEQSGVPVTNFYLSDEQAQIISPEVWKN